jgi:DNA topoisomerase-1
MYPQRRGLDEGFGVPQEQNQEYRSSAEQAGLHYVDGDGAPGYRRKRWGRGFAYVDEDGAHLKDEAEKARIKALAIPPDWEEVWVASNPAAHIQATGRDEAGRKQYIYHPGWEEVRRKVKFDRLIEFAKALPQIRARCDEAMRRRKIGRERVLAVVVALLDRTMLRIGHEEYLKAHGSHGLTTLAAENVELSATRAEFKFVGKSAVDQHVVLRDRRLAAQLGRLDEGPGERVFSYIEDGETRRVSADEVNEFLQETTGIDCSAKDFRTWGATRTLAELLIEAGPTEEAEGDSDRRSTRDAILHQAVCDTAEALGNTDRICRDYYLHPAVLRAYEEGRFWPEYKKFKASGTASDGLSESEGFVIRLAEQS